MKGDWSLTQHAFPDQGSWAAVRDGLGWSQAPPDGARVIEIGVLHVFPDDSEQPSTPLPGWHVDIQWRVGSAVPDALAASRVTPQHPRHRWA